MDDFPLDDLVSMIRAALEGGAVSELRQEGHTYRLVTVHHDQWWYRFASANAGADWVASVYPARDDREGSEGPDLVRQIAMVDLGTSDAERTRQMYDAELVAAAAAIGPRDS